MNKNYNNGRAKEYRLKKKFQKEGYVVLRTAGSHGFADLIAIKDSTVLFIQVKPKKFAESAIKKLCIENRWVNKIRSCEFVVM